MKTRILLKKSIINSLNCKPPLASMEGMLAFKNIPKHHHHHMTPFRVRNCKKQKESLYFELCLVFELHICNVLFCQKTSPNLRLKSGHFISITLFCLSDKLSDLTTFYKNLKIVHPLLQMEKK